MKLKKSPLILVLAQIRFSPILSMGRLIEEIQENFRKSDFPLFEEEKIHQFKLNPNVSGVPEDIQVKKRWIFTDLLKHNSIILTEDFIAFETSNYDTFDVFKQHIKDTLSKLSKTIELSVVERIGLRYVDLVTSIDNKKASELIKSGLRGFSWENPSYGNMTNVMTISQMKTQYGRLVVRTMQTNEGIHLPPDLSETKLEVKKVSTPKNEESIILDFDHYTENLAKFNLAEVLDGLKSLHDITGAAFKQAVTDEAIKLWS